MKLTAQQQLAMLRSMQTFRALRAPVKRVCALQVPIPYSPQLESSVFPDREKITAGVRSVLRE